MPPGMEKGGWLPNVGRPRDGQWPAPADDHKCRPKGGLNTNACLVARLADAGAIVLPYSYTGAVVSRSGGFTFSAYDAQDTYQPPAASIANLGRFIKSVATAWPSAQVVIIGHSYGGTVASG